MKKISFVVGADYQQNKIFDLANKFLNRDNCLLPYYMLKEEFLKSGYELVTSDSCPPKEADLVLYNEMPKTSFKEIDSTKSYLMLFETELIRPDNWDMAKHRVFKRIFTWNDKFVDNKKYIKFNFPNEIRRTLPGLAERTKLLTSISGNKSSSHPLELYSKRLQTIEWFEKNHPDLFEYYGVGWDYKFNVRWQKLFRKIHLLNFFPKNKSICYKGKVHSKFEKLKEFKFALCYENARNIDCYITEKIFDCFFSGTIPVYWGANNIQQYIPSHCFIDRSAFKSEEELCSYLLSLYDEQILQMQKNIYDFLSGPKVQIFSNEHFVKTIVETMLNE